MRRINPNFDSLLHVLYRLDVLDTGTYFYLHIRYHQNEMGYI